MNVGDCVIVTIYLTRAGTNGTYVVSSVALHYPVTVDLCMYV